MSLCACSCVCIYIYIYIYIERERERERDGIENIIVIYKGTYFLSTSIFFIKN